MNPIEITLNQLGDNKTHMKADIRCKWTPLSLQGEHFIPTIFWIPDGSCLPVRMRFVETLLAINFFPLKVNQKSSTNSLWFYKFPGRCIKGKTKAWTVFWIIWTKFLGDLTRCHTTTNCTLFLIYMTFEFNMICLWQHPAPSNQLDITKTKWSDLSDPIVITHHSLTQLQLGTGNWKIAF